MPDTPTDAQMYRALALAQGNNRLANALARAGYDLLDAANHLPALLDVWAKWIPPELAILSLQGFRAWRIGESIDLIHLHPDTRDRWMIEGHARDCIEKAGHDVETGRTRLAELDTRHATAFRTRFASDGVCAQLHASAPILAVALVTLRLLVHANANPDA